MRKIKKNMQGPFYLWEDYIHGMYKIPNESDYLAASKYVPKIMSSEKLFWEIGLEIFVNWPIISRIVMDSKINKIAWLGQAACCYEYSIPELATRLCWKNLDCNIQKRANKTASKLITFYESYRK